MQLVVLRLQPGRVIRRVLGLLSPSDEVQGLSLGNGTSHIQDMPFHLNQPNSEAFP